jgi:hypothetical protein
MNPLTETALPMFVEFFADATGVGKSFAAWRARYHFEQAGIKTTLVRVETRGVAQRLRAGDIFVPVEDFAQAGQRPGGLVGVLAPLSAAIGRLANTRRAVVIADWAGGLAQHHAAHLAATQFDKRLAELGVTGISFVATTNRTEQMRQAAEILRMLATTAPGLHRGLLLNDRFGGFSFPTGSRPAAVYRDLVKAAQDNCAVITLPAVVGESWKYCEDAGLRMPEVVRSTPAAFAKATGLDPFTAAACVTEVAAFWELSEQALNRVWRFRA